VYLRGAFERIAEFMNTNLVELTSEPIGSQELIRPTPASELPEHQKLHDRNARLIVPIRLSHGDARYALLGGRRGGQPYLSEDLEVLARMGACVAEQVEQLRDGEIQRLVSQAELRALQSQIHPHFLFNALNTLYGVIPREAAAARKLLLSLADIFRYFLHSERTFVPLEEEIRIVRAYLSIEEARLGNKLRTEISVDEEALHEPVPILSIEPLVENAVKHGVAIRPQGGLVRLEVSRQEDGLHVSVFDTGPGFAASSAAKRGGEGVGLENVRRRIWLCYGPEAHLCIQSSAAGTTVSFCAPSGRPAPLVA
jgi:LytS/YehU family sensor histidine kinase